MVRHRHLSLKKLYDLWPHSQNLGWFLFLDKFEWDDFVEAEVEEKFGDARCEEEADFVRRGSISKLSYATKASSTSPPMFEKWSVEIDVDNNRDSVKYESSFVFTFHLEIVVEIKIHSILLHCFIYFFIERINKEK